MFNKKSQDQPAVIDLDLEVVEDAIIFRAGPQSFRLPKDQALALADRGILEERFRAAAQPDEDMADLDNIPFVARLWRLWRHGLSVDQAAALLGESRARLTRFGQFAREKYDRDGRVSRELDGLLADDYIKTKPSDEFLRFVDSGVSFTNEIGRTIKPEWRQTVFICGSDVAMRRFQGMSDAEIALGRRVPAKDFAEWASRNEDMLKVLEPKAAKRRR